MKKVMVIAAALAIAGCGGGSGVTGSSDAVKVNNPPKLLLSHIECADDGTVDVHFVLLFAGTQPPGTLTGTYNGGSFGPTAANKLSGNVWHYDVFLPSGDIDILDAVTTTAAGVTVSLFNPDVYTDTYACGAPVCDVSGEVTPGLLCTDQPLGNETAECAYFGLVQIAKDIPTSESPSFTSTLNAPLALVKTGSGACGGGDASYEVYVNVVAGDVLYTPEYTGPNGNLKRQAVSHVTYCTCAPE
jgi:hypothetical protein